MVDISNRKRAKLVKKYNVSESDIPLVMALGNNKKTGRIFTGILNCVGVNSLGVLIAIFMVFGVSSMRG